MTSPRAPRGRFGLPARRALAAVAVSACGAAAFAAPTSAAEGGGTTYVAPPKIAAVKCAAGCMKKGAAVRGGGALKVAGSQLSAVQKVIFTGGRGKSDDVEVKVTPSSDRAIKISVPMGAASGPLVVWVTEEAMAKSKPVKIMAPLPPIPSAELTPSAGPADAGAPALETGTSTTKWFKGARGGVEFKYRVSGDAPVQAEVALVRQGDGAIVRTWPAPSVAPGSVQSVRWDGTIGSGDVAPEGRYMFLLSVVTSAGAGAKSAGASNPQRDAFDFYHHIFPVRGKHNYGQSGARFGAGRSGHSHQGQDIMAACGTKLVAARGGQVKFSGYHSAAGNYIVIDGDKTGTDYAYMHLATPSPLKKGDRVYTGQEIGPVGTTGSSTACHLHFEEWSAPGWYDGGSPFDPYDDLLRWDSYS